MVRAHSLLYAIYICLIVSLLCGALIYIATLYGQLNVYYTTHEDLYIHNQSVVNYALANLDKQEEMPEDQGIEGIYKTRQYGLYTLLLAHSVIKSDSVASAHFAGQYAGDKSCLYLTDFSKPLSYSGTVTLTGEKKLPAGNIRAIYLNNATNKLTNKGTTSVSQNRLPELKPNLAGFFTSEYSKGLPLTRLEKLNDSLYYNSFFNPTQEITLESTVLQDVIVRGNFILRSKDSVYIKKTAILEDVIISAPSVAFEEGFAGSIQAFATRSLTVGDNATLTYPSALCIYNPTLEKSSINIGTGVAVYGTLLNFGFSDMSIENNTINIKDKGVIVGDIYCAGMLSLQSNVYGSVYTNRLLYKTSSSMYENCLADVEINVDKRPLYFISAPLFGANSKRYGLLKKLL